MLTALGSPWSEIIFWLAILIITIIVEIETIQIVSIWFSAGALVALLLAAFNVGITIQIIVFITVSVALLISTRPFVKKLNQTKTDNSTVESMIGEIVTITKPIEAGGIGEIRAKYDRYTAIAPDVNEKIEIGTKVKIKEITGNKVIVELI